MGAVAWGALLSAVLLAVIALHLGMWRRRLGLPSDDAVIDLVGVERAQRADDLAFDRIVGSLLLGDPTFADSADRLARQDDTGPAA